MFKGWFVSCGLLSEIDAMSKREAENLLGKQELWTGCYFSKTLMHREMYLKCICIRSDLYRLIKNQRMTSIIIVVFPRYSATVLHQSII